MPLVTVSAGNSLPAATVNQIAAQVIITCTSSTHPSSPPTGQWISETDTGNQLYWNGSVWRQFLLAGTTTISTPALNTTYPQAVTFPTGWFQQTPSVVCSITGTGAPQVIVTSYNEATTGVTFAVYRTAGSPTTAQVRYFAYGP